MRKDNGGNGGTIINMASIAAFNVVPHCPVYNATKSGILSFSICLGVSILVPSNKILAMLQILVINFAYLKRSFK